MLQPFRLHWKKVVICYLLSNSTYFVAIHCRWVYVIVSGILNVALWVLFTVRILSYQPQRSCSPSALLGMRLILTTKLWWPITFRLHRHRVSLVVERKQNEKCMLGSFGPAVHSHFAFACALGEALLTLKSPPEGEFNTPAAFQWFSSRAFLLLFFFKWSSPSFLWCTRVHLSEQGGRRPSEMFFNLYY